MPHETTLIATIVMGLVLAFAGGFLASKLRLPPLVGYLLAGRRRRPVHARASSATRSWPASWPRSASSC